MNERPGIIFLNYIFPPCGWVGAVRNYKMALEAAKNFDVYVLTSTNLPLQINQSLDLSSFKVFKVKNADIRARMRNIRLPVVFKNLEPWRRLKGSLFFNTNYLEGGEKYSRKQLEIARELISKKKIKYVYSSYGPWIDHIIASKLKEEFSEVNWICDFRDYPDISSNKRKSSVVDFDVKRINILKSADRVLSVSNGLSQWLSKQINRKVETIYTGSIGEGIPNQRTKKFRVLYCGSFYGPRDFKFIFKNFERWMNLNNIDHSDIEFLYIGNDEKQWREIMRDSGLLEYCVSLAYKSFIEMGSYLKSADLLLHASWSQNEIRGILGQKIFEYRNSATPILSIIFGNEDDEIYDLVKDEASLCWLARENETTELYDYLTLRFNSRHSSQVTEYVHQEDRAIANFWQQQI